MQKLSVQKVLGIVLVAILLTAFLSYVAFSPDLTFETVLEQGSMNTESTFVVFKDGSTYYLKDGETGEIADSNTNASALFNDNMENYTTFTIKTPYDSYDPILLTAPILYLNNTRYVTFQGESDYGLIQLADGADCDMFQIYSGCHWLTWKGLYLHGNVDEQTVASHGIRFMLTSTATSDIEIVDCGIVNFRGSPVYFEGTVSASYIRHNYIEDSTGAAIRIGSLHTSQIESNVLWNCSHGIQVENTTLLRQDNLFDANIINAMTEYGIYINQSHNNRVTNNRVSNSEVGIYINVMNYGEISDNWLITIDDDGIDMYSLQFCTVSGNNVYGASQETNDTYVGIQMGAIASGECHSNLVEDNLATNSNWSNKTAYGFFLAGDHNLVLDSYFTGSDVPMAWTGSNNEVHDCYNGTAYIA